MKKTLILLAMVIALVILPFLSITAASTVVRRRGGKPDSGRCAAL
jgi:hypothetical protein